MRQEAEWVSVIVLECVHNFKDCFITIRMVVCVSPRYFTADVDVFS